MAAGQSRAFAELYERQVERVYAFLAYRLFDRAVTEDLTQVTFERALRAWGRFDPSRASESTWLLTIARNAMIDHLRRDREQPVDCAEFYDSELMAVPGPEERVSGSPELLEALAGLKERDREVIALRYGAELTTAEIAALLDLRLANVHQILSRSLRKLRLALGQHGPTGADRSVRAA